MSLALTVDAAVGGGDGTMVKVRSSETDFVGIEIQEELTWNTEPADWISGNEFRAPFVSEDIHFEDDVFPDSNEFAALGALIGIDKGRRIVRGSLVCEPQYNNIYFWKLFAQAWGAEDTKADESIYEAAVTGLNTHGFTPGSGIPVGMSMRVWKSGPNDAGSRDLVTGLIVTRMVWDQPEGDRCTVTFDFIGGDITTEAVVGETMLAFESPIVKFKATDFERAGSKLLFGATTQTALNITGFTLTIDRNIDAGSAFLNNLTTLEKPGIIGNRSVELVINSVLEQNYNAANKPWSEFAASPQLDSKVTIGYEADTIAVATTPYALRFDMPKLIWTDVRPNLTQAGEQPFTATGRAALGAISALTAGMDDHQDIPSGGSVDVRALCHVADGDEPAGAGAVKFSDLPNS